MSQEPKQTWQFSTKYHVPIIEKFDPTPTPEPVAPKSNAPEIIIFILLCCLAFVGTFTFCQFGLMLLKDYQHQQAIAQTTELNRAVKELCSK